MSAGQPIAAIVKTGSASLFGSLFSKKPAFVTSGRGLLFAADRDERGVWQITRVDADAFRGAGTLVVWVNTARQERWELECAQVAKDSQGFSYDLRLCGSWEVAAPEFLLRNLVLDRVGENTPWAREMAESWIANYLRPRIRNILVTQNLSVEALRQGAVLPEWWANPLNRQLQDYGIVVTVESFYLLSAEAARQEVERRRQDEQRRIEEAAEITRQAEIRRKQQEAEYRRQLAELETNQELSEMEREHRGKMLRFKLTAELLRAEEEVNVARREQEKATLEHEKWLAQQRRDIKAIESADQRKRQAEERADELAEQLKQSLAAMEKFSGQVAELLGKLVGGTHCGAKGSASRYDAAEYLANVYGMHPLVLKAVGVSASRQELAQVLREQVKRYPGEVVMEKQEIGMRDILGVKKISTLRINTPLRFKFRAQRDGYVTVLNIGTSGAVYLHVPNAYVPVQKATCQRGETLWIPGSHLLPQESLDENGLEYLEVGPPGWEHLAVIVSEQPLIPQELGPYDPGCPFRALSEDEIRDLRAQLAALPTESWRAGILTFLVENQGGLL